MPVELAKELARGPDGYDAGLAALRDVANALIEDEVADRDSFVAHFDELPPSVQGKALATLRAYPHLTFLELYDKVQGKLTLAEAAEAQRWFNKLKVIPR